MTFNKITLPNGIRLVTIPMSDNPSVTVLVMVETGSKYETKEQSGLSHFLEHMFFKGSTKRPNASDISRELDSIGANYNAFTSHEFTGYYAKAASRHISTLVDVISDMYINPIFDQKEMEKEKGVIVEEIRMYNDQPQRRVSELFTELLYGDQPAGWNIAGTEDTVRSFTREVLTAYRNSHYTAPTTTVFVSGSFDSSKITELISTAFAKTNQVQAPKKASVTEKQSLPAIAVSYKETDQTHLVIGLRTFSIMDPRIPEMYIMSTILGGGMSSRLFSRMRDQLGICYYIRSEHEPFTDHGFLSISAGVDNARVQEAIEGILGECRRLRDELIPQAEVDKAKEYIAGTTMLGLETSDARAEFCAYQEVLKHTIEDPDELIMKIRAVTAQDVQKLAQTIFVDDSLNMAVVGKFKDSNPFKSYFKI